MSTYPIDIVPTVLDVAALLRARTKDSTGYEVGTFNDDTRPTSAQVLTLIDQAVADVQAWLGPNPPGELAVAAKVASALDTACLIELSYYPEQVQSNSTNSSWTTRSASCSRPRAAWCRVGARSRARGSRCRGTTSSQRHRCRSRWQSAQRDRRSRPHCRRTRRSSGCGRR